MSLTIQPTIETSPVLFSKPTYPTKSIASQEQHIHKIFTNISPRPPSSAKSPFPIKPTVSKKKHIQEVFRTVCSQPISSSKPISAIQSTASKDEQIQGIFATTAPQPIPSAKPLSPIKPTISKEEQIQNIFATKSPKIVLDMLHAQGYTLLNECRCCPQFSRSKNEPLGNPDVRGEVIEKTFVEIIYQEHPDKEKPLTICSLGSGTGFEDLLILSKLGYKNVSWILVDPLYSGKIGSIKKQTGEKLLLQFIEVAKTLCPGIKIQTIDFLKELYTTKLISTPDVVFDFDDGLLGATSIENYMELQKELVQWIYLMKQPVLFLHTMKSNVGVTFNPQKHCLQRWFQTTVNLSNFRPMKKTMSVTLSDSIIPKDLSPSATISMNDYLNMLFSNNYEAVSFCLKHGINPNQKDSTHGYTFLMLAAEKGLIYSMKALVEHGHVDINARSYRGLHALQFAVYAKTHSKETIDYLIQQGALINRCDDYDFTPLMRAAEHGYIESMQALLAHKPDLTLKNNKGQTAHGVFTAFRMNNPTALSDTTFETMLSSLKPPEPQDRPTIKKRKKIILS